MLRRARDDERLRVGETRDLTVFGLFSQRDGTAETALVLERAFDDEPDLVLGEWLQGEDARSRQERRIDLERRVLRRGPEQRDVAILDVRQHDILLRLVEAVDLVDEQNGALVRETAKLSRLLDDLPELGDT